MFFLLFSPWHSFILNDNIEQFAGRWRRQGFPEITTGAIAALSAIAAVYERLQLREVQCLIVDTANKIARRPSTCYKIDPKIEYNKK